MGKFNLVDLLNGAGEQAEQQEAARAEARPQKPPYKIVALSVFDLVPSEGNFYSIDEIEKLKRDIELAGGVKQNLTVTPLDGGKYKILAGHRRRRACLELVEEGKRISIPAFREEGDPSSRFANIRAILNATRLWFTVGRGDIRTTLPFNISSRNSS